MLRGLSGHAVERLRDEALGSEAGPTTRSGTGGTVTLIAFRLATTDTRAEDLPTYLMAARDEPRDSTIAENRADQVARREG